LANFQTSAAAVGVGEGVGCGYYCGGGAGQLLRVVGGLGIGRKSGRDL